MFVFEGYCNFCVCVCLLVRVGVCVCVCVCVCAPVFLRMGMGVGANNCVWGLRATEIHTHTLNIPCACAYVCLESTSMV